MESETHKICSCHIQKASSQHLPLLTSHCHFTTMSTNASSISTVSSLPIISLLSSGHSSPASTRSDAGWGISQSKGRRSPDVHHVPTPPPTQMKPTPDSPVIPPPILSINISISAHRLRKGTLEDHRRHTLHSLLYAPHLRHALEFHLKANSPFWSITSIYLQNQRLKTNLNLTSSPSSIGHRCNTLCTIQQEIKEDLFSTFYQLEMPEFINDVE